MSLSEEERDTIVSLQMEKSKRNYLLAEEMYSLKHWELAANRYYYACFHVLQALMVKCGFSCHTHAGLIATFGMEFVKKGKVEAVYGRFISRLEQLRERSDYNCYYDVSEADVQSIRTPAKMFIDNVKALIESGDKLD